MGRHPRRARRPGARCRDASSGRPARTATPMIGLKIEIVGDTGKLDKTLDQTQAKVGGFGADIGGTALKVAGMATVAGAAALRSPIFTSAAAEDEAQQGRLESADQAAGAATGDYKAQVDAAISAGQDRAFSNDQRARGAHVARDHDRGRHARDRQLSRRRRISPASRTSISRPRPMPWQRRTPVRTARSASSCRGLRRAPPRPIPSPPRPPARPVKPTSTRIAHRACKSAAPTHSARSARRGDGLLAGDQGIAPVP